MTKLMKVTSLLLLFTIIYSAKEPVFDGPCQGCEFVFVDMPANLSSQSYIALQNYPGEELIIEDTVYNLDTP